MLRHLKLSHHTHTASHRPHEHTSYVPLMFLLVLVGASLTLFTSTAFLWERPGPEPAAIGLTGVVPGKPPTEAATIDVPSGTTRVTQTPITVSGTCPENLLVEIYKNDVFGGSVMCDSSGTYTIEIDLLIGRNVLTAHVYDSLSQSGPISNEVIVFYDVPPNATGQLAPLTFGGEQLVLNTDAVFRGTFPDEDLSVPIDIIGGRAPYALNILWGDTTNKVISRPSNQTFRASHVYTRAGVYSISIQATDADGRVAFLTVAAIVNGQPYAAAAATATPDQTILERLLILWPLYVIALTAVTSFWLGERREKHVLEKRHLILHPN